MNPVNEFLWSAWTEIGIRGTSRRHTRLAIDPEPLIVFTATLGKDDLRLQEQVFWWCAHHGERVSKSRLQALKQRAPSEVQGDFERFEERLAEVVSPWSHRRPNKPMAGAQSHTPPLGRRALVRLRLRAMCGVGVRADVLAELLSDGGWHGAPELDRRLAFTRRRIHKVLRDVSDAALAEERGVGNASEFRLLAREHWLALVDAEGLGWLPWFQLLELCHARVQLVALRKSKPTVQNIETRKIAQANRSFANTFGLPVGRPAKDAGVLEAEIGWIDERVLATFDPSRLKEAK